MGFVEHLRDLIQGFAPEDHTEAKHHQRIVDLLALGDQAIRRDHYTPGHITASAFVLSPEKDALLLIFHSKLHRWLQPGGHIDADDTDVLSACLREVAEETGVTQLECIGGVFDVDVHDIPSSPKGPGHQHFDVRFLFRAISRDAKAGSDAMDAKWVPLNQVQHIESDASVMRAVRKLTG